MQQVRHLELADPLTAEVIESRLIARLLPRYNRAGTRADKYSYVRLDSDAAWPRLAVVKSPSPTGMHLGPLTSRAQATLVVEALQSALPLRRCSVKLSATHVAAPGATPCSPCQLGVSQCPCAGVADARTYRAAVTAAQLAFAGRPSIVVDQLAAKMFELAAHHRFEEAALVRDRLQALQGALRRQQLTDALRDAGRCEVRRAGTTWVVDDARLVDVSIAGTVGRALPVDPPAPPMAGMPLAPHQVDEALCLARYFDRHASRLEVTSCTGVWRFPVPTHELIRAERTAA